MHQTKELCAMCLQHFVNTQMMVQAEPKLLRPLRRSDVHSDKVLPRVLRAKLFLH